MYRISFEEVRRHANGRFFYISRDAKDKGDLSATAYRILSDKYAGGSETIAEMFHREFAIVIEKGPSFISEDLVKRWIEARLKCYKCYELLGRAHDLEEYETCEIARRHWKIWRDRLSEIEEFWRTGKDKEGAKIP